MKKLISVIVTALAAAVMCVAFTACKDKEPEAESFVGSYELSSLTAVMKSDSGTYYTIRYRIGDTVEQGHAGNAEEMVLSKDYQTLEVKQDGTFVWSTKFDDLEAVPSKNPVFNGTWTSTEEGAQFTVSAQEVYTATLKDGVLTLTTVNNGVNDVTVFNRKAA